MSVCTDAQYDIDIDADTDFALEIAAAIQCISGDSSLLTDRRLIDRQLTDNLPMQARPIGVFDSGVGGLSILQHLQQALPHEQFVYLADTLHVPYGERAHTQIEQLTHAAVDWLYQQGCKLVVIACNSASTHSLPSLREKYAERLPIVGLVPALKPAVLASKTKKVAVLATQATLNGYLLNQVINEIATPSAVKVLKYAEPRLVPWVESGMPADDVAFERLNTILTDLRSQDVDCLVLGCTHYPFFSDQLATLAPELHITDSGEAIARRVVSLLTSRAALVLDSMEKSARMTASPKIKPIIFTTGDSVRDKKKISRLLS